LRPCFQPGEAGRLQRVAARLPPLTEARNYTFLLTISEIMTA
jgi:hypothetical protein